MLKPHLQKLYRPLVEKAWQASCKRSKANPADKIAQDVWYRKLMVTELGIYTSNQLRTPQEIDQAFLAFAREAGDVQEMDYWSKGDERRALWRLEQNMRQAGVGMDYARAVARNMGFGDLPLPELPAELILKVSLAIYKHAMRKTGASAGHTAARG